MPANEMTKDELEVLPPELREELDDRTLYTYRETGEDMECNVSLEKLIVIARRFLDMAEVIDSFEPLLEIVGDDGDRFDVSEDDWFDGDSHENFYTTMSPEQITKAFNLFARLRKEREKVQELEIKIKMPKLLLTRLPSPSSPKGAKDDGTN